MSIPSEPQCPTMVPEPKRARGLMRFRFLAGLVLAALTLGVFARPASAEAVKYRDRVFTDVDITRDVTYAVKTVDNGPVVFTGGDPGRHPTFGVPLPPMPLKADIYQPRGDVDPLRPAIVFLHGRGLNTDKADGVTAMIATLMAEHGMVVMSINYRDDMFGGHQASEDVRSAISWLVSNASSYRVDPTRVAAGGVSAGAFAALEAAYLPVHSSGEPAPDERPRAAISIVGNGPTGATEPGEPPVLMIAGETDAVVPIEGVRGFCDSARATGVPCTLRTYPEDHFGIIVHATEIEAEVTAFLWDALDLAHLPATTPTNGPNPTIETSSTSIVQPPTTPTTPAPTTKPPASAPRTSVPPVTVTPRFAG